LLAQAERQAADLTPQGVANVCAACARLQGPPAIPLRLLRAHAHTLSACDVAEACWALGKLWIDSRASDGAAGTTDGPAGASGAEVVPDWVGVAEALWRRAAQVCGGMDWQAAGRLEFSFRSLAPLSLHGAVPHSPLLDQLSRTALASIRALERSSGNADSAAAAALLRVGGAIWSDHSTHPEVLFALVPGLCAGKDCYDECESAGPCNFCGPSGACCQDGHEGDAGRHARALTARAALQRGFACVPPVASASVRQHSAHLWWAERPQCWKRRLVRVGAVHSK